MRIWTCPSLGMYYLGGCAVVIAETEDEARAQLHDEIIRNGGNTPANDLELVEMAYAKGTRIVCSGDY